MHSKSDNIEIMISYEAGSEVVLDYALLLYYKCHKVNRGGSYIDFPASITNKKAAVNPISKKIQQMLSICCDINF